MIKNEDKGKRWKDYLEDLYKGSSLRTNSIENEKEVDEDHMGAPILRSEFDAAVRDLWINKASGIVDFPAELIKTQEK